MRFIASIRRNPGPPALIPTMKTPLRLLLGCSFAWSCAAAPPEVTSPATSFEDDATLVQKHLPVVILTHPGSAAKVLVAPSLQGRVLTSTVGDSDAPGFGWINRDLIASGQRQPHINAFGGEDRLWLGPEGGQYGFYFPPGAPYDFAHWQTPPLLDTEPFDIVAQRPESVVFQKEFTLVNHAGTSFHGRIDRTVRILGTAELWRDLGVPAREDVQVVAYESDNCLTNLGPNAWEKSTGLPSIWMLGQFNASPRASVVIPYRRGLESALGPVVESNYFGTVPEDRLRVGDGLIYFRVDAHYRSKIGLSGKRARPIVASYDAVNHLLTFVQSSPPEAGADYVNSLWKEQEQPFAGSAVNSYNDGPNDTGKSLGDFYEMETSSPALALAPQQWASHFQRTIHLRGDPAALAAVAREVLGTDVDPLIFH